MELGVVSCCAVGSGVVSCCAVGSGVVSCCAVGSGVVSCCAVGSGVVSCCAVGSGVVSCCAVGSGVVSCCAVGSGVVSCSTAGLGVGLGVNSCCALEMRSEPVLKSGLTSAGENWWIPYSPPQTTKIKSKAFDQDHRRWRSRRSTRIIALTPAELARRQWHTRTAARAWRCRAASD